MCEYVLVEHSYKHHTGSGVAKLGRLMHVPQQLGVVSHWHRCACQLSLPKIPLSIMNQAVVEHCSITICIYKLTVFYALLTSLQVRPLTSHT